MRDKGYSQGAAARAAAAARPVRRVGTAAGAAEAVEDSNSEAEIKC